MLDYQTVIVAIWEEMSVGKWGCQPFSCFTDETPKDKPKSISYNLPTKPLRLAESSAPYLLEVRQSSRQRTSNQSTVFDKDGIASITLISTHKQDLFHNLVSGFSHFATKLCHPGQNRGKVQQYLVQYLSLPVAQVTEGIVLGGGRALPAETRQAFTKTGLTHLLSASGANLSLFYLATTPYFRRKFGTFFTTLFSLVGIFGYLQLAGCVPSLIRATVTANLTILAGAFWHRKSCQIWTWAVVAVFMVISHPAYLSQVSFQLSVTACLGVLLTSKLFPIKTAERLDRSVSARQSIVHQSLTQTANFHRVKSWAAEFVSQLREWLQLTTSTVLAVQLLTLPITILTFGQLSTVSLVSTVAVIWIVPLIFLGAIGLLLLAASPFSGLAHLPAAPLELTVRLFVHAVQWFAHFPWATLSLSRDWHWWSLLIYIVPLCFLWRHLSRQKQQHAEWQAGVCQ